MHKNNFDFLRLLFAIFVIYTHSYILSGNPVSLINLSYIGVRGFFIISGYLIFQSAMRSNGFLDYYIKRFLRLWPALTIVLILTVLLGSLIYQDNKPYFLNGHVIMYIPNNLTLYKSQQSYEGMFTTNPYPNIINGSLWTIVYEFTFYIIISLLIFLKHNNKVTQIVLSATFLVFLIAKLFFINILYKLHVHAMNGVDFSELGLFFIAGSILASIDIRTNINKDIFLFISTLILIISTWFGQFYTIQFLTIPFIVIIIGLANTPYINNINSSIGADLSYGLYIYSFPIQQTFMYFFKLKPLELFVCSLFVSLIFSYLSWNFIEKKALKYKTIKLRLFF